MKLPVCNICDNSSSFHWDSNHTFCLYTKDNGDRVVGALIKIIKPDMEISIDSLYEKNYYTITIFDARTQLVSSRRIKGILQLDKQKIEFLFENPIFI
jgi:hypothetical protein